jgi:hypothetical protein
MDDFFCIARLLGVSEVILILYYNNLGLKS